MYQKMGKSNCWKLTTLYKVALEMVLWENFDFQWCTHKNIYNILIFYKDVLVLGKNLKIRKKKSVLENGRIG